MITSFVSSKKVCGSLFSRSLQKPPVAKVRKQVHKQPPGVGAHGQLDVVVFDPLHEEVEEGFAASSSSSPLLFAGGADKGDGCVEDGVAKVRVLEFGAEVVGFY